MTYVVCPFCGTKMEWKFDTTTYEMGYDMDDKLMSVFCCPKCGSTAEFIEGGKNKLLEVYNEKNKI